MSKDTHSEKNKCVTGLPSGMSIAERQAHLGSFSLDRTGKTAINQPGGRVLIISDEIVGDLINKNEESIHCSERDLAIGPITSIGTDRENASLMEKLADQLGKSSKPYSDHKTGKIVIK